MPKTKFTVTGTDGFEPPTKCCKLVVYGDDVSDGYHSMDELYDHRLALTVALFHAWYTEYLDYPAADHDCAHRVMKSKLHFDGTMFEGYFIVMALTVKGQISYHYKIEHWDKFNIPEVERTPEWDGHDGPETVKRLLKV